MPSLSHYFSSVREVHAKNFIVPFECLDHSILQNTAVNLTLCSNELCRDMQQFIIHKGGTI